MSDAGLSSRFSQMKPFSKGSVRDEDDDRGEHLDHTSIAGGGHGARPSEVTRSQLRVSHALKSYLVHHRVLSKDEGGVNQAEGAPPALRALVERPHISVPASVTDRSHPLPEYFISSSHNTYLLAHQLYGTSSATAYETALSTGSRCVEIDAWDNEDNTAEPKVTHGYTLVSHIPFRSVCETIRDVLDKEVSQSAADASRGPSPAPILLSLENHCSAQGQQRLVDIMKEVWGERLLDKAVRQKGHREQQGSEENVRLDELGSKIVVIVEYHFPSEKDSPDEDASAGSSDESEAVRQARRKYAENKKTTKAAGIIPELAELGVYAQSVKPRDNTWYSDAGLREGPHHHLINVSESGLRSHLPAAGASIARHNAQHLMRVYPKGTRISSANLKPAPFWGIGAQICAMNWQTFGASMQLNEALFSGSDGFILKPAPLRTGGDGKLNTGRKKRLRLHVGGATDVPVPDGRASDDIKPYLTCTLVHPDDLENEPPKKKTSAYKHHKLKFLHHGENPPATDPIWDETLEWEYADNELVFLRMLVKSDDSFARNPVLAVAAVRLLYAVPEWRFIRLLDLKGRETKCSILVRFDIQDA